jgi:methyl-accepting chemotaxis protein
MLQQWTFSRRISASMAIGAAFTVIVGLISIVALRNVTASYERVIAVDTQDLLDAKQLATLLEHKSAAGRGFLLAADERFVGQVQAARGEFATLLEGMKRRVATDEETRLLAAVEAAEADHQRALERVVALRRTTTRSDAVAIAFEQEVSPRKETAAARVRAFAAREERGLVEARKATADGAATAIRLVIAAAVASALFAVGVALVLARALNRQIGTAVTHVQNSSVELQTAANQQATGAKEQTTAMSEITTTITELLATSRQIAETAQRVAEIAEKTTGSAQAGESTVDQAHDSIAAIRQQMDMVVNHMLELGKKSQQIGAVVDIVSELAEQTNILAINATIEAAGAGEAGARFAVVADEIRQLADRVGGSTKEIRPLIDDMRGAVNTTVMATETGSKAVDAGSRQFAEVASSFKQIAGLVKTSSDAAREIELSTKQQATAVEQVNVAIASVAQTTRETEVSSRQTLDTVSQLAGLSKDLRLLVQPQTRA